MNEYEFELTFTLADHNDEPESYIESLGESCTDAVIGIGKKGEISFAFIREDFSAAEAIISAISDIKKVINGVRLVEAKPDIIGLSDIANLIGHSRQYVRKIMLKKNFPAPVHMGSTMLWHLKSLQSVRQLKSKIEESVFEVADFNRNLNIARELVEQPIDMTLQELLS